MRAQIKFERETWQDKETGEWVVEVWEVIRYSDGDFHREMVSQEIVATEAEAEQYKRRESERWPDMVV